MEQRGGRRLVVIDIAVPRDIEPSVRDLAGVDLYDMDDLGREVERNLGTRAAEAERARGIVDQEVARFEEWLAGLDVVPTIAALRERGDAIVEQVLRENASRWESLSEADRERVEVLARAIVNRLLHDPTLRLKRSTDASYVYVQALRELFALEPPAPELERGAEVTSLESRRQSRPGSA